MANTLGYYNPEFYAQEALIQLEKALGMAGRVYRGYDEERRSFGKGEYINIRKPSTFSAANAPASAVDLATESVQIQLAYWREVKFALTDKELSFTSERIIEEHIRPQAYALADDIDQKLAALYVDIPWYYDLAATSAVADLTGTRKILFDNNVPLYDVGNVHYMVNSAFEEGLLKLSAFSQQQGAGDVGINTQMRGSLGMKYGMEIFANQNVQSHTAGAMADGAGAIAANESAGATDITIDDLTDTQTVKAGDSFVITGDSQRYVFTEDGTVASNALTNIGIYPALVADAAENAVVTIRTDSHAANLAFHRNAFALAMAPLSPMGNELGAKIATVTDPVTGLSLRSRIYYVGNSSAVHVALDVLYGVKTLDPNLACRGCGA
jgi:hypothetical protein